MTVDPKTGRRFVNETGNRKVRSDAIVATGHPTHDRARNGELFGVGGFRKENRLVFTRGGGKLLFERGLSVVFGGVRGEGVR